MKFSAAALVALFAATGLAAPAPETKSMATANTWTIESMKRVCNKEDTSCDWSFGINAGGAKTSCKYTVKKQGSTRASRSPQKGAKCGDYTVTSGWSGQFGEGQGFTTLSVVNNPKRLIAWPAYTDKQLAGGKVVKPNQSYPVQALP